jgi:hypothetical protein
MIDPLSAHQINPMKIEHQDIDKGISDFSHFDGSVLAKPYAMPISVAMKDHCTI